MVIFKVTDGFQTRKFGAPSGVTFNDVRKKLSSVFPDSVSEKENSDLILHYRDSEGDVITLSSDSEHIIINFIVVIIVVSEQDTFRCSSSRL